ITIVSDGWPTDPATGQSRAESTLDVAARLAKAYPGKLCFHTIQVGSYSFGTAFLQKLSNVTECGSHREASSLTTGAAIEAFQHDVYLARVQVAAVPSTDSDGDGVTDDRDACPGTPKGVRVDARGCWVAAHLLFDHDSAAIAPSYRERLLADGLPIFE